MKSHKQTETFVRAFSNQHRIHILELLDQRESLSTFEVARGLGIPYKTASSHLERLVRSGLIAKEQIHGEVFHELTENGRAVLSFLRNAEQLIT